MATIVISFILLTVVVAAMAIGVILQGKPIKGSCGGISALGMDTSCDICGGDAKKCEEENQKNSKQKNAAALAYDASKK